MSEPSTLEEAKRKKTIFISMVDATEEDVERLYQDFMNHPDLLENYHGIITSHPVQTMDPGDLITALKYIYNVREDGDPHNIGLTRTGRFRFLYRKMCEFMDEMIQFSEHVRTQFENLRVTSVPVMLPDGTVAHGHIQSTWNHHTSEQRMKEIREQLEEYKPNEGEEW